MMRSALDAALTFARRGWPVFPCHWCGERRKRPLTVHGLQNASRDSSVIAAWWRRWPQALIGLPTGSAIGAVVLDVDVKDDRVNGYDTLNALGFSMLPHTPMAHTASGGLHLYFAPPVGAELRNTAGGRGNGIGPGLDWRGQGGYVIAPAPHSGYQWDPHWNFETVPLAPVPAALLPQQRLEPVFPAARSVKPTTGLSAYGEAALNSACRNILTAGDGVQEATLNTETFTIGTLVGGGALPADFAKRVLIHVAQRMTNYDPRRPWRMEEIDRKINRAFSDGMRRPRSRCDAA